MTLHVAKGLEYPAVVVTGLEETVFPHRRALSDDDELEEERRLFYVGVTRAMRHLVLTHAWSRTMWGQRHGGHPQPLPSGDSPRADHRPHHRRCPRGARASRWRTTASSDARRDFTEGGPSARARRLPCARPAPRSSASPWATTWCTIATVPASWCASKARAHMPERRVNFDEHGIEATRSRDDAAARGPSAQRRQSCARGA